MRKECVSYLAVDDMYLLVCIGLYALANASNVPSFGLSRTAQVQRLCSSLSFRIFRPDFVWSFHSAHTKPALRGNVACKASGDDGQSRGSRPVILILWS